MWVACLRSDVNHRDADTQGVIEGYHNAIKTFLDGVGSPARRLDRLLFILLHVVTDYYTAREALTNRGMFQRTTALPSWRVPFAVVEGEDRCDAWLFGAGSRP